MIHEFSSPLPQFCYTSLQLFKCTTCWHVQVSSILWFLNWAETSPPPSSTGDFCCWFTYFYFTIWFPVLFLIVQISLESLVIVFFLVWMARKEVNGMSEPHLKFRLYKLKRKLRLEFHKRYSLHLTKWGFGKSYLVGISFELFLQLSVHFYRLKGKHELKSRSRKPHTVLLWIGMWGFKSTKSLVLRHLLRIPMWVTCLKMMMLYSTRIIIRRFWFTSAYKQ